MHHATRCHDRGSNTYGRKRKSRDVRGQRLWQKEDARIHNVGEEWTWREGGGPGRHKTKRGICADMERENRKSKELKTTGGKEQCRCSQGRKVRVRLVFRGWQGCVTGADRCVWVKFVLLGGKDVQLGLTVKVQAICNPWACIWR